MKHQHIDFKHLVIAFVLGALISGSVAASILRPKPLSASAQWCIANPKYADWAKARHEKVLKAAEEVYLEK